GVFHRLVAMQAQRVVQRVQARCGELPVIECLLQRARDAGGAHAVREVAADDDQRAIATAFLEGCKFHVLTFALSVATDRNVSAGPASSFDNRVGVAANPAPASSGGSRSVFRT